MNICVEAAADEISSARTNAMLLAVTRFRLFNLAQGLSCIFPTKAESIKESREALGPTADNPSPFFSFIVL